ncbi:homocysteine S-methyltransferase family protein [Pseudonocardia asaccharolytica]|uniref:Bifunctional homocysteine S-methyltransferase/methylenetetrahydrofolate reductase n=1 Tax=Pseudonocardia asaccharolytica DSM 44247 = NBRC 16224 TaxID=1123024 RepID=A0A511D750_9PSEU|nr:homocysteine S-methyltransferase family protein [Pseudonocardia asaccharolytica]GEL20457.1 bifunctional homocysteine S-methyltransferase/methylenetetrahydrofolate reductase [Pseudonocardia asaccharolytica DSM 44247 = NBRC 16224]
MSDRQGASGRSGLTVFPAGEVVVADGAVGTMLHAAGIPLDQSLSELNVGRPKLVRDLHAAYVGAGARILQTNTFDANRLRLASAGLADRVTEINIAGARLAREAAEDAPWVKIAGSVGPAMSAALVTRIPDAERASILREQIAALADWVDLIILETFGEIESLVQGVQVALDECDVPVIAQLTFGDDGRTLRGEEPAEVAAVLSEYDLAAIGANCTVGPAVLQEVVAELAAATSLPVSVQPNAGTPRRLGRALRYAHNVDYFAEAAAQLVAKGATVVGGCCGTTPAHTRAMVKSVAGLAPLRQAREQVTDRASLRVAAPVADPEPPRVAWRFPGEFVVLSGTSAPHGEQVAQFVTQGKELIRAGARLLAVIDPDPPATRVNPLAAAVLLRERVEADVILQIETAGRSLSALQADLLGAHALGLRMLLCRTGAPRVVGDYPDPGSLWDVDSVRLIGALSALNDGVDWRGVSTSVRTRFVIGASLRTAAVDKRWELDRAVEKVRAGAHFFVTEVIYDVDEALNAISELRERGVDVPVIAAIAPFGDVATIARRTHENANAAVPSALLPRLRERDPVESIDLAFEAAEKLAGHAAGILVHGPSHADSRVVGLVSQLSRMGAAR